MKNAYPVSCLLEIVTEHEERNDKYGEDYDDPACGTMNNIDSEILMWVSCSMEDKAGVGFFSTWQAVGCWLNLENSLNT